MKELAKPTVGDSDLGQWLNRLRENVAERSPRAGDGIEIDYYPDHFRIKSTSKVGSGGGTGKAEQMLVKAVHRDHLECKRVTLDLGVRVETGEVIRVAKPDELRAIGWDEHKVIGDPALNGIDGYTYTYHAVSSGTANPDDALNPYDTRQRELRDASAFGATVIDWAEEIVPKYIPSYSVIYAVQTIPATLFDVNEAGIVYAVTWIDLNVAGRRWDSIHKKVKVCTGADNTDWFALLRTSDNFRET